MDKNGISSFLYALVSQNPYREILELIFNYFQKHNLPTYF